MHLLGRIFTDVMVTMFFIGLAGSAIVILISFIEDFRELFGSDEPAPEPAATANPPASIPGRSQAEAR
jgi:hypothetical protein